MYVLPVSREDLLHLMPKGGVVAEIGVEKGDFSQLILERAQPDTLHLIDPWQNQDDPLYQKDPANAGDAEQEDRYEGVGARFQREIAEGRVVTHRKFSTDAVEDFADGTFDWVYIDGLHTYEGAKGDLENYRAKVKENGLILGHDYTNHQAATNLSFGVIEAANEFVENGDYEFLLLTNDIYPTYVLTRNAGAGLAQKLLNTVSLNVHNLIEIRDYPSRPFVHKLVMKDGQFHNHILSF